MPSRADVKIVKVPPHQVLAAWPLVAPLIRNGLTAAVDRTYDGVLQDLVAGDDGLWLIIADGKLRATVLTCFYEDPEAGEKFLSIYGTGGEACWQWGARLNETLKAYGASHHCKSARCCGRNALKRFLPDWQIVGSKMGHNIYERALS